MKISVFVNERRPNADGSKSIYLRITADDRVRFLVKTGLTVFGKLCGLEFPMREVHSQIKSKVLHKKIEDCEEFGLKHPKMPSPELKEALASILEGDEYIKKEKPFTFFVQEYIDKVVDGEGTAKLYKQTKNVISEFDADATFETITPEWLENLYAERVSEGRKINGIGRTMRDIRAVFNYARKKGYTDKYPFFAYTIKNEATKHRNISVGMLRKFLEYECEEFQIMYRDIFMLSLYLWGINIGDLLLLRPEDYRDDYIYYNRQKTDKPYIIKVEPEAREIIEKYRGEKFLLKPMDSLTDYHTFLRYCNRGLQSIGKTFTPGKRTVGDALIPFITTYYARHTVATLAAEVEVPMETISMGLGHSMNSGALVTHTYVEFQQWRIDDAMRKVIDYIKSGKTAKEFVKQKQMDDSGIADILKQLASKL